MKKLILALLPLLLVFSGNVGALSLKPYEGTTPKLELNDTDGKTHLLDEYKGKTVLVQFWATYCTPCRQEMPSMNRLQAKMRDKLKILAVNMGESKAEVEQFIDEVKPEFTILYDADGKALKDWKVFAAPANFILGPDGKIHYTLYGGVEWDSEEMVAALENAGKQ